MPFVPWVPTAGNVTLPLPVVDGGTGATTGLTGLANLGTTPLLLNDEPTGTLARTQPRAQVGANTLAALTTTGTVVVRSLPLPAGLTVTNIQIVFGSTGASGPTHFWLGLTDANLNVLAVSADQGSAAQTASTPLKLAMGTPYLVTATGLFYVAVSSSATTTAPTLCGFTPAGGIPGMVPICCGTAGTQAAPPSTGTQINGGVITAGTTSDFAAWIS